jgi:hypothetical protein
MAYDFHVLAFLERPASLGKAADLLQKVASIVAKTGSHVFRG